MGSSAPPAQVTLEPGTRLDRYELLCVLAHGGMANVWLARVQGKLGFQKLFAVKTILPNVADDAAFKTMFLDEARIASRIEHPNVVHMTDVGEAGNVAYLVMDLVEGEPLHKLPRACEKLGQRIPLGVVLRILADACHGLHAAHELKDELGISLNVVHRDMSPSNILVAASGVAKVIDFGVAKARDRSTGQTTVGTLKGKISYMPREQALGQEVDRRADTWALGAVLYYLLAGRPPYKEEAQLATLQLAMNGAPIPPLPVTLPISLRAAVTRALAHEPSQRYQTAAEMGERPRSPPRESRRKKTMGSRHRAALAGGALAALLFAGTAHAQSPNAADRETARALMDEGRGKEQKKDLRGALASYRAADAIMHVPTTGIAVARTQAALGMLVEARDTALGVIRIPVVAGEPPVIADGRKAADDLATELAPRIPTVKIGIGVPAGVTPDVTIDDVSVSFAAIVAARRLNPGHHVILAKVGTVERKAEVDLAERDAKSVQLDFPADVKPPAPVVVVQPGAGPAQEPAKRGTTLIYIGVGVGGAGLLVGLGAGIFSLTKVSSAKDDCKDTQCPPSTHSDLDTATTAAVVSNIGFIVAGAGAATAVVGILLNRGRSEPKAATTTTFRTRPYVGAGQVGVTGEF